MKQLSTMSLIALGLIIAVLLGSGAAAQPQAPSERLDRDRTRLVLLRRIEGLEQEKSRLQDAIERLDAGAPVEDVRAVLADAPERNAGEFEMTPELRERALRVFEATNPELFGRWKELQERDPERAEQLRERILRRIQSEGPLRDMLQLLERDPELFQLRAQQFALERRAYFAARHLVEATARGENEAAAEARHEIHSLLSEQLEIRFAEQRKAMREAEERISGMRQRLEEQSKRRDELVEQRVEEIIRRVMDRSSGAEGPWRRDGDRESGPKR